MILLAGMLRDGKETRRKIAELVAYHPGIHVSDISERLGLAWSTAEYHVRLLAKQGFLDTAKQSRELRLFARGIPASERGWLVCLRDADTRLVLRTVLERPEFGIAKLSDGLDLSKKTIRHHLDLLVDSGILQRHGEFRPRFRAAPSARPWIEHQIFEEPDLAIDGPQEALGPLTPP